MGQALAKIIQFPSIKRNSKQPRITNTDGFKYFTNEQIRLIRRTVRDKAESSVMKEQVTAIREWAVIDLLTSTGLRVSEAANVRCSDIRAGYGESSLFVRNGKGQRSRTVQIPDSLKRHLKAFVAWKQEKGEDSNPDAPLFIGQRGHWTAQAVQQIVKKHLRALGLYENDKSVHALRHSYAVEFYRQQKDIRALQKQLGHANIQTTQIYADVTAEDIQSQVRGLWGGVR